MKKMNEKQMRAIDGGARYCDCSFTYWRPKQSVFEWLRSRFKGARYSYSPSNYAW